MLKVLKSIFLLQNQLNIQLTHSSGCCMFKTDAMKKEENEKIKIKNIEKVT